MAVCVHVCVRERKGEIFTQGHSSGRTILSSKRRQATCLGREKRFCGQSRFIFGNQYKYMKSQ